LIATTNYLNFFYCFDENFNEIALTSIISLLDNVSEPINIHCLHNNLSNFPDLSKKISEHKNLNKIYKYEFKHTDIDFPNLDDSHISEATYYRLFIDQYVSKEVNFVIYIDSDVLCISDPIFELKKYIKNLESSKYCLAAKTELLNNLNKDVVIQKSEESAMFRTYWPFERLNVKNKYFNAGFMILDLEKWKKDSIFVNLIKKLDEISSNIVAWDQDVLNAFFNGRYIDLPSEFNKFSQHFLKNSKLDFFIHFYGSKKPWTVDGITLDSSEIYQNNFRKINKEKYHIKIIWKKYAIKLFFKNIVNLKIFKLDYPFSYMVIFFKTLLRK